MLFPLKFDNFDEKKMCLLQILAEIAGVQIQIALEAYNTMTGCKILHRYNTKERSWIKALRTLTGQCATISSCIADTTEAPEPRIMVLTRAAAQKRAHENEMEQDTDRDQTGEQRRPQQSGKGPDEGKGPYNPNEEVELGTSLQEVKRVMREETKQQMGVIIAPSPGPKTIKGERIIGEVYQDSIAESHGDTSIKEMACIIAAIANKEPNSVARTSRKEVKQQQDTSPDIQSAIRALKINDKEAIQKTWEKTPPKQRTPTQQFLL